MCLYSIHIFYVLLFACTLHFILYRTPHQVGPTCHPLAQLTVNLPLVMSLCTYNADVLLVWHTIVVSNKGLCKVKKFQKSKIKLDKAHPIQFF